jgi:predicted RNA-binding Zn-ribbon protein involved in translation (DUF1610 family)
MGKHVEVLSVPEKCPGCGTTERLFRSRTRGFNEQVMKSISAYRMYECHDCGWRGYMAPAMRHEKIHITGKLVVTIVLVLVIALLAGYLVMMGLEH